MNRNQNNTPSPIENYISAQSVEFTIDWSAFALLLVLTL